MERITIDKFEHIMRDFNSKHPEKQDNACLTGVIVYKASNWPDASYSETQRSYRVSNANRGYQPGKISNSIVGDCLDGKDLGVRLDWYKWAVDYCYLD